MEASLLKATPLIDARRPGVWKLLPPLGDDTDTRAGTPSTGVITSIWSSTAPPMSAIVPMPKHEPAVYFPPPTRVYGRTLANPQPPETTTVPPSGVARTDAAFWEFCTTIVGLRVLLACG